MECRGPVITRKYPRTTKKLKEYMEAYRAPESPLRLIHERYRQEHMDQLQDPRYKNRRFGNYKLLAEDCWQEGQLWQMAFHDTARSKEAFYRSAVFQMIASRYYVPPPESQPFHSFHDNWLFVDLWSCRYFEAAVIADADGPARALAHFQLNTECRHLLRTDWEVDRAIELLYLGRDAEAAESCAYARRAKEPRLELDAYEAILDRDPQRLYDALLACISGWRRSPNFVEWMKHRAVALGKIAVTRGLAVPIDTEDCPQCLIQPETCDYSALEIPAPVEGFPWEEAPADRPSGFLRTLRDWFCR